MVSAADGLAWPAFIVAAGLLGAAVGKWIRSEVAPLLATVLLFAVVLLTSDPPGGATRSTWQFIGPLVPLTGSALEFDTRPGMLHVGYVTSIGALFALIAIRADSNTRSLRWAARATTGIVLAFATALLTLTLNSAEQSQAFFTPEGVQTCTDRGAVTYCAYPAYFAWVDHWEDVVSGVLSGVPEAVRRVRVTQRPMDGFGGETPSWARGRRREVVERVRSWSDDDEIHPGMYWLRPPHDATDRFALALEAATQVVGIGGSRRTTPASDMRACNVMGEARGPIALWLAVQADTSNQGAFRRAVEADAESQDDYEATDTRTLGALRSHYIPSPYVQRGVRMEWSDLDSELVEALLRLPQDEVRAHVIARWDGLVDPRTSTQTLRSELRLEQVDEQLALIAEGQPRGVPCG